MNTLLLYFSGTDTAASGHPTVVVPIDGVINAIDWSIGWAGGAISAEGYQSYVGFTALTAAQAQNPSNQTQLFSSVQERCWLMPGSTSASNRNSGSKTLSNLRIPVKTGQKIYLSHFSSSTAKVVCILHISEVEPRGSTVARVARSSVDRFIAAPERSITGSENLKARVVRADKAAACCRKGQLIILRQVTEVLSDCFAVIQGLKSNETIVLAGGVIGTAPAFVRTSTGLVEFEQLLARPVNLVGPADADFTRLINQVKTVRPAPRPVVSPGQIAVLAGVTAAGLLIDVAAQTAALEAVSLVGGAINGGVQYRPDQCTECVLAACLPQNAPRQRQKTKILRRVGGADP